MSNMKTSVTGWHVASIMAPMPKADPVSGHIPPYQGWKPCYEWCEKHFGSRTDTFDDFHSQTWHFIGEGIFEFKHEQDLLFFLLKWK